MQCSDCRNPYLKHSLLRVEEDSPQLLHGRVRRQRRCGVDAHIRTLPLAAAAAGVLLQVLDALERQLAGLGDLRGCVCRVRAQGGEALGAADRAQRLARLVAHPGVRVVRVVCVSGC